MEETPRGPGPSCAINIGAAHAGGPTRVFWITMTVGGTGKNVIMVRRKLFERIGMDHAITRAITTLFAYHSMRRVQ
jgi:hypothetical protein